MRVNKEQKKTKQESIKQAIKRRDAAFDDPTGK